MNFKELKTFNELNEFSKNNERIGIINDSYIIKTLLGLDDIWMIRLFKDKKNNNIFSLAITMEDESEYIIEFQN